MIRVSYKGRLGNNLFQYSMGRVLAHRYGYYLDATPIDGFENTKEKVDGLKFNKPHKKLRYNRVRLDKLDNFVQKNAGANILLRGTFGYYPNLKQHKDEIRRWFYFDNIDLKTLEDRFKILDGDEYRVVPVESINNNDVLLHIRLGDLLKDKVKSVSSALYFDYYKIILERSYGGILMSLNR